MYEDEFPVAAAAADRRQVRYGPETAAEILRRTAAGESLLAICRGAGMPLASTVCLWLKQRPKFAEAMHAARVAAGGPFRGRRALWCEATAQAIYDRVCAGEAVTAICAEPGMPSMATLTAWRRDHPEFEEALQEAYEIRAETWFERGWEMARAVTPETAYAAHVKLQHLRWYVGKLVPRRYGSLKPTPPPEPVQPPEKFYIRNFEIQKDERGWARMVELKPDAETGEVVRVALGPFKPPRDAGAVA